MSRCLFSIGFVLVAASSTPALAQGSDVASSSAADPLALSLGEALAIADARAPRVATARAGVRVEEARRVGAGVVMPVNPKVTVEGRPLVSSDPFSDLGYAGTLDFAFDLGGAPSARVREADAAARAARAELDVERREARVHAWAAYVHARAGEERVKEQEDALAIAERVLTASKARSEAGATGDSEEMLAESERDEIRASLEQARSERELALMQLRDVLDLAPTRPLTLTTPLEEPPQPALADALVKKALTRRPELAAYRTRIALLDATYERLSEETFPRIGAYAGLDAAPLSPVFGMLGISVELPIVQRNQGPRAVTSAMRDAEAERLELFVRAIGREVVAAHDAYDRNRARYDLLATKALPAAQRTLELVEAGWRAGRFDVFRVTSAARDVARLRGERLDALEATWAARVALDRAVGGLGS